MSSHSDHGQDVPAGAADSKGKASKRFRFKRAHSEKEYQHGGEERCHRHRHHHRRHHHRSKRRKTSPHTVDDPAAYDDSAPSLPPDVAFRESLFDALGDDEGAAFWEGVYGQPIHNYPNTYQNRDTGELERMDDEEYAQHVRQRMWEKSREGIEVAKEAKRKAQASRNRKPREQERTTTQERQYREPDYLFDLDIDQSLRRGERRREKKHWKALWGDYLQRWDDLLVLRESGKPVDTEHVFLRNKIAWPVESGKRKDINSDEIERFIRRCAESMDDQQDVLTSLLKTERVRWHPDKIQQRYGFMEIDESTMQGVTAVFQTFDRLWGEIRDKKA